MRQRLARESERLVNNTRQLFSLRSMELILIDTIIVAGVWLLVGYLSALALNSMIFNGKFTFKKVVPLYILIVIMRFLFSMYNSVLRYADAKLYAKLIISDAIAGMLFFFIGRFWLYSVYVGFSYTLITIMMINLSTIGSRLFYQIVYARIRASSEKNPIKSLFWGGNADKHRINIAIVGAGNIGASLAGELKRNPESHYYPLMFIDTDPRKIGSEIQGIRIYRENDNIIKQIKSLPIKEIVIALPDSSSEDRARLYNLYKQTDCKVKIYDYQVGNEPGSQGEKATIRDFSIEDLLFRDTVKVRSDKAKEFYKDKVILVTGGGGSIGSELCRQIAKLSPKKLVILDIYENNAYDIQQELVRKYGDKLCLEIIIASVRDEKRLEEVFNEQRPQIVFHAAAHKHVPLMEHSGCEAIKNNVFGTYYVANMAEKYSVEKFLLISTDKAVNPTNIMGASKRLCEMIIQCRTNSKTEFTAVRFGNVLGSNGSVIPLFKKQIAEGGPITITDKRIIRYFMTIPEAVGLVMETCAMAKNGELYVLDMGNPVKILDLAENMIRLSGYKPYEDIDIIEVGLRPGEKLYEELLMKTEELGRTANEKIFIERDKGLTREEVDEKLRVLSKAIEGGPEGRFEDFLAGYHDSVLEAIRSTVPTYNSPDEANRQMCQ